MPEVARTAAVSTIGAITDRVPATANAPALVGSGDYRSLAGNSDSIDWDGDQFSAHLGLDARLPNKLLVGVALSWSETDLEYEDELGSGNYSLDLNSAHSYPGWNPASGQRCQCL